MPQIPKIRELRKQRDWKIRASRVLEVSWSYEDKNQTKNKIQSKQKPGNNVSGNVYAKTGQGGGAEAAKDTRGHVRCLGRRDSCLSLHSSLSLR
uniref:Uncharacterized protein n=1 Tax=Rhizophora mucronata TaxID=61149 RepID=A0A2P2KN15_RHIMU